MTQPQDVHALSPRRSNSSRLSSYAAAARSTSPLISSRASEVAKSAGRSAGVMSPAPARSARAAACLRAGLPRPRTARGRSPARARAAEHGSTPSRARPHVVLLRQREVVALPHARSELVDREAERLREPERVLGLPPAKLVRLAAGLELLAGELADRLEQRVARAGRAAAPEHEVWSTSEERRSSVVPQTASTASSVQPPAKTDNLAKVTLLVCVEQIEAPLERRPQRALAGGKVARPAGQEEGGDSRGGRGAARGRACGSSAAASSIASGRPSRRSQIAPTASPEVKDEWIARARARKNPTPSAGTNGAPRTPALRGREGAPGSSRGRRGVGTRRGDRRGPARRR